MTAWLARSPDPALATGLPGDEAAAPGKGAASARNEAEGAVRLGRQPARERLKTLWVPVRVVDRQTFSCSR